MKNCSTINHRNQSLNLLKGFACIGVVFIHICFPDLFGQIIKKLSGFAVPCFYMIAGFYAYQANKDVIKRRLIKILKIFIYAILLFFIFYLIVHIINNNYQEWLMSLFTLKNLFKSIVFCTIDFAIPLWYLIGMIETYVLWFYVVKNKKESIILKFLPLLFILRFILTSYVLSNNLPWCLKMNFLTCSLSWFLLGYYINLKKQIIIEKCKNSILSIYLSFGCIVALIPVIFRTSIDFSCIGIFFYSAVLFIFAIKYENYEMSNS